MNVLLVSQCTKRAVAETRRILDQFAERRGDRTWQTAITKAGLDTLRRLLRKTARKNTAVACHWIRGKDHSELLWIVGDARQFNAEGATPTNFTRRNVLRRQDENDWHHLSLIQALSALAALLHDLGKASRAFQARLRPGAPLTRNLYRHEWVSLRLFQAFVGNDTDTQWLARLASADAGDLDAWLGPERLIRDGADGQAASDPPFKSLPPLAGAVAWLVLTHHRMPVMPNRNKPAARLGASVDDVSAAMLDTLLQRVGPDWNERVDLSDVDAIQPYWEFEHGLPVTQENWRRRAARVARRLLAWADRPEAAACMDDPYIMHVSRLALMLADHHYSTLTDRGQRVHLNPGYALYANTARHDDRTVMNQTLDEHLLGVEAHAGVVVHALPGFEHHLPRLLRHKKLNKRSGSERFRWQDRSADLAASVRMKAARHGAFFVNMASTGSGKTLANARIMNALADPGQGLRCAFAMGLRTLTLQTGRNFREDLGLADDALAILVGGAPSRELFEHFQSRAEQTGSASSQSLLVEEDEAGYVEFEGNEAHPLLMRLSHDRQFRSMLAAPVLVCTVDHLMPATESLRGGRQIAPMLRLMSGDLVLDEPDDFDLSDLPALTRLVHWAGLLGSRVLLSSATLPPALVEGLFLAYRDGRAWYQRNRGERPGEAPDICCAWFDEFHQVQQDCPDGQVFEQAHADFVRRRHAQLSTAVVRRRVQLWPLSVPAGDSEARRAAFASTVRDAVELLHKRHHGIDPHSGKRVSFGLVRMANIDPLFDVALALYRLGAPAGTRIHLCVYHSRFPLLMRSAIERRLDRALNRREADAVFGLPEVRNSIDRHAEQDHVFLVLGSPVTEIGRDHDYDWAVVEPSSMRSLIQLAGRVRRHRPGEAADANICVLNTNLRHFEHPGEAAFKLPGFEADHGRFLLKSHDLAQLLHSDERDVIDARPRILSRPLPEQRPQESLVDLEHGRLRELMLPGADAVPVIRRGKVIGGQSRSLSAADHWTRRRVSLTGILPQQQPFRGNSRPEVELALLPNEEGDDYCLHRVIVGSDYRPQYIAEEGMNGRLADDAVRGDGIVPWGEVDYMTILHEHAQWFDMDPMACAKRFATVSVPDAKQGWRFHPALGFTRRR